MGDTSGADALRELDASLGSLIPRPVEPAPEHLLALRPLRVAPAGLGGYIGAAPEGTAGDMLGVRVRAKAVITARAATLEDLDAAVLDITTALLGADRAALRLRGFLTLALDEMGPRPDGGAEPAGGVFARDLTFSVLFEYVNTPVPSAGVIDAVHIMFRDPDSPLKLHEKPIVEEVVIVKDQPH